MRDGSCITEVSEREEHQRPAIDEAIKLLSEEQNNMRGITRRARALPAGSHGSPHVNLISKATP